MIDIQTAITKSPKYQLIKPDATAKESTRTVYDMAVLMSGKEVPKESPEEMFNRAGSFVFQYVAAMESVVADVLESTGLIGGVVPCTTADTAGLTKIDQTRVFQSSLALHHAYTLKDHVTQTTQDWFKQ